MNPFARKTPNYSFSNVLEHMGTIKRELPALENLTAAPLNVPVLPTALSCLKVANSLMKLQQEIQSWEHAYNRIVSYLSARPRAKKLLSKNSRKELEKDIFYFPFGGTNQPSILQKLHVVATASSRKDKISISTHVVLEAPSRPNEGKAYIWYHEGINAILLVRSHLLDRLNERIMDKQGNRTDSLTTFFHDFVMNNRLKLTVGDSFEASLSGPFGALKAQGASLSEHQNEYKVTPPSPKGKTTLATIVTLKTYYTEAMLTPTQSYIRERSLESTEPVVYLGDLFEKAA